MKEHKALFAGSFDPVTNGHLWVIKEASELFDELVVSVTYNAKKPKGLFSVEERGDLIAQATVGMRNVTVLNFAGEYTANFAHKVGAKYLVRGIRNGHDFDHENLITNVNRTINPDIVTWLVSAPHAIADVSSSMVKGLIGPKGWEKVVKHFVPPVVLKALKAKQS
jgi:pantetheine-phosphate adenylyltransferase